MSSKDQPTVPGSQAEAIRRLLRRELASGIAVAGGLANAAGLEEADWIALCQEECSRALSVAVASGTVKEFTSAITTPMEGGAEIVAEISVKILKDNVDEIEAKRAEAQEAQATAPAASGAN